MTITVSNMKKSKLTKHVQNYIIENKTSEALELLLQYRHIDINEVILLYSRFNRVKKKINNNLINESDSNVEINKIHSSILLLLQDKKRKPKKVHIYRRSKLEIFLVTILLSLFDIPQNILKFAGLIISVVLISITGFFFSKEDTQSFENKITTQQNELTGEFYYRFEIDLINQFLQFHDIDTFSHEDNYYEIILRDSKANSCHWSQR